MGVSKIHVAVSKIGEGGDCIRVCVLTIGVAVLTIGVCDYRIGESGYSIRVNGCVIRGDELTICRMGWLIS